MPGMTKMLTVGVKGIRRLFTKGPVDTARWTWYHIYERYREWSLGIKTNDCEAWVDFFGDSDHHVYEPLCYACIDRALSSLTIRPGQDAFLDYGSGQGRIVTVAATYPFDRVIGIDMVPELNDIAEANIRRAQSKLKCKNVELHTDDATQYTVPPDVTVIFLFNPFRGDVLRAVQQQMHRSVQQTPRKLTIIYINPREDPNLFSECDWLVPVRKIPTGRWDTMRFLVYETHPSVETSTAGLGRESESVGV